MARRTFKEEYSPKESMEIAKKFLKENKTRLNASSFGVGNLLFLKYNAKDKTKIYNKNPLIMVLRRNNTHTLGINFHWLPYIKRIELIRKILEKNKRNIKAGKPLKYTYPDLKIFLKARGYSPCIRLYINKRYSKTGCVVPPTNLLGFARLNMMVFTGGISTAQVYNLASKKKI